MTSTKLLVIADDFTGGLDTGVQFARQGIATRIMVHPDGAGDWWKTDSQVLWLRCDALRGAAQSPLQFQLQARFTAMLARRTLRMNDRIQILSRGSLREKLNAFFAECARDAGGPVFDLPFDRAGMAAYLGADRSALSRELSRMAREGVVRYRKNHFELIPAFD